jgi:SAM-dependent methyltransferase
MSGATAAERWASELAAWAIPDEIMAQAPESPWEFSPALFRPPPPEPTPDTPSRVRAREALPEGGSVLDVGCGGGAAGLALVPPAGRVTGFDQSRDLLDLFVARAVELGVAHEAAQGTWPDDAAGVAPADVVVTHHVAYNVADLGAFAAALTSHARNRVVMELSGHHPRHGLNDLWRRFWDAERPEGPTADDAIELLTDIGLQVSVERSPRVNRSIPNDARVASVRKYLCLPADREPEIAALLADRPEMAGEVVTLWWDGGAQSEV